jgi:hypothetical protein
MDKEELKKAVLEATFEEDGRTKLTCSEAFRLAEKLDVKLLDITRACNSQGIRICKCQLGCFK